MVFVFTGAAYQQVIMEACKEAGQMVVGNECREDLYILPFIKDNYQQFVSLECTVIDLNGIKDRESEIIKALDMLKMNNSGNRIILLAAHREPGDALLAKCVQMSVHDIIVTPDFLEIKKELIHCIREGKDYKDSVIFREALNTASTGREQKKVDHVHIGIAGTQPRIGVTHHAVAAANYLRKQGYMVSFMEENDSGAVSKIADGYQLPWHDGGYITKGGIDFYKKSGSAGAVVEEKAYNFVIHDFGLLGEETLPAYKKCARRIVMAGTKAWEEGHIQKLISMFEYAELKELYFYFNFCPPPLRNDVKNGLSELRENVYFTELAPDPFESREPMGLDTVLMEYLPREQEQRTEKKERKTVRMKGKKQRVWLFEQYKAEHPEAVPEQNRQGRNGTRMWNYAKPVMIAVLINILALLLASAMNPEVKMILIGMGI